MNDAGCTGSQKVFVASFVSHNDYGSDVFFLFTLGKGVGRGHKISDYFEVGACSSFILLLVSI